MPSKSPKPRALHIDVDVKAIRQAQGLSQSQFSKRYGLSISNIRNWEQGVREPDGPAKLLFLMIAKRPDLVVHVVRAEVGSAI